MYPPSLYRSISYASKLGVPMYITENGCPYVADTSERTDWINGYLTEVATALAFFLRQWLDPQCISKPVWPQVLNPRRVVEPFDKSVS